ncbi:MAG TPA: hypothetical protein VIX35_00045 [Vicinamibacterales bacterium]
MPLRRPDLSVIGAVLAIGAVLPAHAAQRSPAPSVTAVAPVPPPTQLEDLLTRPNTLVTQDLYRVTDRLSLNFGLTIDAVVAKDVMPGANRLRGIRVEVRDQGPPDRIRTSYVDFGELAGLSQALMQMVTAASQWTGREDTRAMDARFATAGGFVLGFHQDSRDQQVYVSAGLVDPARRACNVQDLATIKTAVEDAIVLLKEK